MDLKGVKMEGWLCKKGGKGIMANWRRRYFRLGDQSIGQDQTKIFYFKNSDDPDEFVCGHIDLIEAISVHPTLDSEKAHDGRPFQINTKNRIFYLLAEDDEDFDYWLSGLVKLVQYISKARETLAEPESAKDAKSRRQHQAQIEKKVDKEKEKTIRKKLQPLCKETLVLSGPTNFKERPISTLPTPLAEAIEEFKSGTSTFLGGDSAQPQTRAYSQSQPQAFIRPIPPKPQPSTPSNSPAISSSSSSSSSSPDPPSSPQPQPRSGGFIPSTPSAGTQRAGSFRIRPGPLGQGGASQIARDNLKNQIEATLSSNPPTPAPRTSPLTSTASLPQLPISSSIPISSQSSSPSLVPLSSPASPPPTSLLSPRGGEEEIAANLDPRLLQIPNRRARGRTSTKHDASDHVLSLPTPPSAPPTSEETTPPPARSSSPMRARMQPSVPAKRPLPSSPAGTSTPTAATSSGIALIPETSSSPGDSGGVSITRSPSPLSSMNSAQFQATSNPNDSHRTKIVREILSTEESYCQSVETIIEEYLKTMKRLATRPECKDITPKMIETIFANIESILPLNIELRNTLKTRISQWDDSKTLLGDVFLQMAPFFRIYTAYSNNYELASQTYTKEMKDNPTFINIVNQCNQKSTARLQHLLITPVQRIPRYNMLLADLLKNTDTSHPDHANLSNAVQAIQSIATYVNESIRQSQLDHLLVGLIEKGVSASDLLAPHRHLIKEDTLYMYDRNTRTKERHLVLLFNDVFVHIPQRKMKKAKHFTSPTYNWPLNLVWLSRTKMSAADHFEIVGPSGSFTVFMASADDKKAWMKALKLEVKKNINQVLDESTNLGSSRSASFVYSDGSTYEGSWFDGKRHGFGTFKAHHQTYVGKFENDLKSGKGVLTFVCGTKYEGDWADSLFHGQGSIVYPSGDRYDGEWKTGQRHGQGTFQFNNGDRYEGEWIADQPHGKGKLILKTGKRYEGLWAYGMRHGPGIFEYSAGSNYDGNWREDKRHGSGIMIERDGTIYDGEWNNDLQEGRGKMTYNDGRMYDGQWRAGKRHGIGTYSSAIGSISMYGGEWNNGLMHGKGKIVWANGDSYEGQFKDNKMSGQGIYTRFDKIVFEGRWSNGVPEGKISARDKSSSSGLNLNGTFREHPKALVGPLPEFILPPEIPCFTNIELK